VDPDLDKCIAPSRATSEKLLPAPTGYTYINAENHANSLKITFCQFMKRILLLLKSFTLKSFIYEIELFCECCLFFLCRYTGCIKKKLNRFEIALNFAKHLFVSGFLYIQYSRLHWVLSYNVE
jgi:hypothetical protein